jgi:hypothetical protein
MRRKGRNTGGVLLLVGAAWGCGAAADVAQAYTVQLQLVADWYGSYHINATTDAPMGLALWGADVVWSSETPTAMTAPAGMSSFKRNNGLNNPAGYGGTLSGRTLLQVGGAQNTIGNVVPNAPYPVGAVVTGIGYPGPVSVAVGTCPGTGSFVPVHLENCFASVITGPPVAGVYPVEPATTSCGTAVEVCPEAPPPMRMVAAESRAAHGAAGTFAIPINLTAAGTSVTNEPRVFSTSNAQTIRMTFDEPVMAPPAGCVTIVRSSTGTTQTPTTIVQSSAMIYDITLNGTGQQAPLADADRYTVTVASTVKDLAGNPLSGDQNFQFILLGGNPTVTPVATKWLVNGSDVSQTQARAGQGVTASNFTYDVIRVPSSTAGVINGNDVSGVQARSGHSVP